MSENRNRLRWLCRRGMKELDIVITQFYENSYDLLTEDQQIAFSEFLEVEDPEIYSWIMGRSSPDNDKLQFIVNRLQNMFDKPVGS